MLKSEALQFGWWVGVRQGRAVCRFRQHLAENGQGRSGALVALVFTVVTQFAHEHRRPGQPVSGYSEKQESNRVHFGNQSKKIN